MTVYDDDLEEYDHLDVDVDVDNTTTPERTVGFPSFPPGKRHGRKFADTWWGNAWIEAMEDTALDREQLRKGRRYACAGQVGSIAVSPGRISAPVHDGDHFRPHRTVVRCAELSSAEWDRFLERIAGSAGHIAALLDREMPQELVGAASDSGVRLLPSYGDLDPECDCPGFDHPCAHAAALSYQASWLLDRDPFTLLLLRGRGEAELVEELHRRNTRRDSVTRDAGAEAGTPVLAAFAAEPGPLPAPPPPPAAPRPLGGILADVEVTAPVDPPALAVLAAAAAERAAALLSSRGDLPKVDEHTDAVRLAAMASDERVVERAAAASGEPAHFVRAVHAWSFGGAAGLDVLDRYWTPAKEVAARLHQDVLDAWQDSGLGRPAELSARNNRWTVADRQLRFGQDGLWYPFRSVSGVWWPVGPPSREAAEALVPLAGPDLLS